MDRRRSKRIKKRLACSLQIEARHHSGVVIDVSATGLFVQTNAKPEPGTPVSLKLSIPGASQVLYFQAVVVRKKVVPPQLLTLAQGGVGLLIQNAPEDWYAYIASTGLLQTEEIPADSSAPAAGSAQKPAAGASAGGAKKSPSQPAASARSALNRTTPNKSEPPLMRFRVRVSQIEGSRSRTMSLSAASEAEARSQATEEAGEGWKIIECSPVTEHGL